MCTSQCGIPTPSTSPTTNETPAGEEGGTRKASAAAQPQEKPHPNRCESLIPQIVPTRTGYGGIRSSVPVSLSAVVCLSAVNGSRPTKPVHVYRRTETLPSLGEKNSLCL